MNANAIKIILTVLMLLDHIGILVPESIASVLHILTRVVGAGFAYILVQSFRYGGRKIIDRLFVSGIIMQTVSIILMFIFRTQNIFIPNNIFLTFGCSLYILTRIIDSITERDKNIIDTCIKTIITSALIFACMFLFEGGSYLLPLILVTFFLESNKKLLFFSYLIIASLNFFVVYSKITDFYSFSKYCDFLFIMFFPLVFAYSGERGKNTVFTKYFFYVFYPIHLWIIYTIQFFIKGGS